VFGTTARYDDDWDDFDPLIRSFDDDVTVRERVIDRLASSFEFVAPYARSFARSRVALVARRMQAQLRSMDDCSLARLGPLPEDATIDADGTVQPPDWARDPDNHYPEPYRLRCVP
jgi:hypothetical protein